MSYHPPKYLYHGTSQYRWHRLVESDLQTNLIYLAKTIAGTEMYCRNATEQDEIYEDLDPEDNPEAIVQLSTEVLLRDGELMPDWDDVKTNMELFPGAVFPEDVTWYESLRKLSTCSYKGSLERAVVKVVLR
jgi:hypothetical protein